jgi:WD40 repeat protein
MALSINLIYEREIKQAQTAFNQGDYIAAAQHIRSARSQPGCDRTYEAVNLWTSLYVHLPYKAFSSAWESKTFAEYSKKADRLCLSADARFVLSGTNLGNLDLWEIIKGRIVCTFAGNINYLGGVCLSGDHKLALSSEGRTLKLWSIQTGDCLRTFEGHTESVETLCFSPDNKFILSGSNDDTLKLWEVLTGRCLHTFEGHTKSVTSVCLSADGRFAVSGSRDDTLKLWEITTGRCLCSFEHPDDKRTEIEERNTHLSELEFGNYIVWESGLCGVNSVDLSPNGKFALSGSGNTLKFWDIQTGLCLRTFTGHKDSVISVCLSANCKFALSGSADRTLKLWEVATGICLHSFEGHTDWVSEVFLSADGRFALSASRDKALKLWVLDWELEEKLANDSDEGIAN